MVVLRLPQPEVLYLGPEAYWVPLNPLTAGGWTPYPLMLGGLIQPFIRTFLPKTSFQDILLLSYDAQKAYCAKKSSLRCYSTVPTLFPDILMALNSHRNSATLSCYMPCAMVINFIVVIVLPIVTGYQNETYMNHLNNYEWVYLPFYTFQRIRKMEVGYLSPTKNTYN